jgi:hypothetical protein
MSGQNDGALGFGVVGVINPEWNLNRNRVVHGLLVAAATTTASTQATGDGASDINVDIGAGILMVDGLAKELVYQDSAALANATPLFDDGQSVVVSIVAVRSVGDGVVRLRNINGVVATTGAQVALPDVDIAAKFGAGTYWFKVADVTVNRTGDQTVTSTYDNTVRPLLVGATVHD